MYMVRLKAKELFFIFINALNWSKTAFSWQNYTQYLERPGVLIRQDKEKHQHLIQLLFTWWLALNYFICNKALIYLGMADRQLSLGFCMFSVDLYRVSTWRFLLQLVAYHTEIGWDSRPSPTCLLSVLKMKRFLLICSLSQIFSQHSAWNFNCEFQENLDEGDTYY